MTKKILTYGIVGGLFLIPFIPFYVSESMFFPFISGKGFLFRILVEVIFGMFAVLAVMDPAYRPRMTWIAKAVGVFTVVLFVADLFGANAMKSLWSNYERMEGFVLLAHLAAYFLVASTVFTRTRWTQFWNISILASVIMSVYGLLQLAGKVTINQGGVRLDATFGNSSYLAIYLVLHIFLCLYMLVQQGKSSWLRWTYGAIAVLQTFILYFTATRGAILGLLGGLFLTAILYVWKQRGSEPQYEIEHKRMRKVAYGFIVAILVLAGGFMAIKNTALVQGSPVLARFSNLGVEEIKSQGRYFVWPMAVKGFLDKPILGWGQENFNFVFNKYYDPRMYAQEQWFDRTHNMVLDWLIAGGILGLAAYVSMYIALFYYVWRSKSRMTVAEKSILTGLVAAYVFHNLFVFDNLISYIMFFSVLAYVHSTNVTREDAEKYGVAPSGWYGKRLSTETSAYVAAPIIGIAMIGVIYVVNVPAIQASTTLIQAITPQSAGGGPEKNLELFKQTFNYNSFGSSEALEQLVQISVQINANQQAPQTTKQQFFDFAAAKIEEKLAEVPNDARYLVFAGNFYNQFAQYDKAIEYLNRAIVESPKKQSIYFELGSAFLGKGDFLKAFEQFKIAYDFEPNAPESKLIYALGAIYTKNAEAQADILPKIDRDILINDNRFLQTYANIGDYANVIVILSERLQKDPTNMQYKLSLASAYAQSGQKQKAIALIREMITQDATFKAQGEEYIRQIQNS